MNRPCPIPQSEDGGLNLKAFQKSNSFHLKITLKPTTMSIIPRRRSIARELLSPPGDTLLETIEAYKI